METTVMVMPALDHKDRNTWLQLGLMLSSVKFCCLCQSVLFNKNSPSKASCTHDVLEFS